MLRLAASLLLLWPAAAPAAICAFPERTHESSALAEGRRVAALPYIVEAEVIAEPVSAACGPLGTTVGTYLPVHVHRVIRGTVPATIQLRISDRIARPQGCLTRLGAEDFIPGLHERGIWALDYRDGEWRTADTCVQGELQRYLRRR